MTSQEALEDRYYIYCDCMKGLNAKSIENGMPPEYIKTFDEWLNS